MVTVIRGFKIKFLFLFFGHIKLETLERCSFKNGILIVPETDFIYFIAIILAFSSICPFLEIFIFLSTLKCTKKSAFYIKYLMIN